MPQHKLHSVLQRNIGDLLKTKPAADFLTAAVQHADVHYALISFSINAIAPLQWFAQNKHLSPHQHYFNHPDRNYALIGIGQTATITAAGNQRFSDIEQAAAQLFSQASHFNAPQIDAGSQFHLLGGFSFWNELNDHNWPSFQPAAFTLPKVTYIASANAHVVTLALPVQKGSSAEELRAQFIKEWSRLQHTPKAMNGKAKKRTAASAAAASSDEEYSRWASRVNNAKQAIDRNELQKVVLSRQLHLSGNNDPVQVLAHLNEAYPACTNFLISPGPEAAFVGSSPELLLDYNGPTIRTEALAGSIGRGNQKVQDQALKNDLLNSAKNAREHQFVVDAITNLLRNHLQSVDQLSGPDVKLLANVQHLQTTIAGRLKSSNSPLGLLSQLHPTPAMGGTPRDAALSFIRTSESFNRGWYAAPIGWLSSDQSGRFSVAIRSGVIKPKTTTLYAGCGILNTSEPREEWQETNLKFRPMLSALNHPA